MYEFSHTINLRDGQAVVIDLYFEHARDFYYEYESKQLTEEQINQAEEIIDKNAAKWVRNYINYIDHQQDEEM